MMIRALFSPTSFLVIQVIDYSLGLWVAQTSLTVARPSARRTNFFAYFGIFNTKASGFSHFFFLQELCCQDVLAAGNMNVHLMGCTFNRETGCLFLHLIAQ